MLPSVMNLPSVGQVILRATYTHLDTQIQSLTKLDNSIHFIARLAWEGDQVRPIQRWIICPVRLEILESIEQGQTSLLDCFLNPDMGRLLSIFMLPSEVLFNSEIHAWIEPSRLDEALFPRAGSLHAPIFQS